MLVTFFVQKDEKTFVPLKYCLIAPIIGCEF
jgi:hypothetical protein